MKCLDMQCFSVRVSMKYENPVHFDEFYMLECA